MEKMYKVTLPKIAANCCECGRKLDSRMVDNPFGSWSIPTIDGDKTYCSYCHMKISKNWDAQTQLARGCESLKKLCHWLAQPKAKVTE